MEVKENNFGYLLAYSESKWNTCYFIVNNNGLKISDFTISKMCNIEDFLCENDLDVISARNIPKKIIKNTKRNYGNMETEEFIRELSELEISHLEEYIRR